MPISRNRFETLEAIGDRDDPTNNPNAEAIRDFLQSHPQKAFTQSEIADRTRIDSDIVISELIRLEAANMVVTRRNYWRISEAD